MSRSAREGGTRMGRLHYSRGDGEIRWGRGGRERGESWKNRRCQKYRFLVKEVAFVRPFVRPSDPWRDECGAERREGCHARDARRRPSPPFEGREKLTNVIYGPCGVVVVVVVVGGGGLPLHHFLLLRSGANAYDPDDSGMGSVIGGETTGGILLLLLFWLRVVNICQI